MPTAHEHCAEELRREQERLALMLEAADMCAWEWNPSTDRVTLSTDPTRMFGLPPGTTFEHGEDFFALIHPEDREKVLASLQGAVAEGLDHVAEFRVVRMDGSIMWVADHGRAARSDTGTIRGVLVNITDRKLAEEQVRELNVALRRRAEELQAVLDVLPVGIFIAEDPLCNAIKANPAGATMLGISTGKASKTARGDSPPFRVMRDGHEIPPSEHPMQQAAQRGIPVRGEEFDIIRDDGDVRRLLEYVTPLYDDDRKVRGSVGAFIDITERKQAEEALLAREAEFRAIFTLAGVGMTQADVDTGKFTLVNRRFCEISGYTEDELLERTHFDLNHPDDDPNDRALLAPIHCGERDAWESEKRLVRKDGTIAWVMVTGRLVRGTAGQPVRTIASILDITDRKLAEQALQEADRRKDEFLAMLAHELRNPLAPIRTAVEVLARLGPMDPTLARVREIISRQVSHMVHLVDDLLDVSRISRGKVLLRKRRIELTDLVRTVVEDHRSGFNAQGLILSLRVPDHEIYVVGDETRLAQALGNLLNNSAKFTDPGGRVTVTLEACDDQAVLQVADTGIGMNTELLARIFEPFSQADSTLDRSRGGLGLGLALVRGLIELHGGTAEAASSGTGRGSRFTLRIPMEPMETTSPKALHPEASTVSAARKVLVIEDNRDAADTLCMFLETLGHDVAVAYEGASGLQLANKVRPDIVICDIGLPGGLDGYGVATALREFLSDAYLVALTGYAQAEDKRRSEAAGFQLHLTKPVDLGDLERILSEAPSARTR